jgi:hypothetical protein
MSKGNAVVTWNNRGRAAEGTPLSGDRAGGVELSGREELHRIERRNDLATGDQLLEVVAVAQGFVFEDANPEIARKGAGFSPIERERRIKHGYFLSNGRAIGPTFRPIEIAN